MLARGADGVERDEVRKNTEPVTEGGSSHCFCGGKDDRQAWDSS